MSAAFVVVQLLYGFASRPSDAEAACIQLPSVYDGLPSPLPALSDLTFIFRHPLHCKHVLNFTESESDGSVITLAEHQLHCARVLAVAEEAAASVPAIVADVCAIMFTGTVYTLMGGAPLQSAQQVTSACATAPSDYARMGNVNYDALEAKSQRQAITSEESNYLEA
mmetsp:Transcript_38938/g.82979  ORF Transcript_38938/g.82979 Transcript_38938/m.82979 type:complete len:167 (-) Transcript_38938:541-1041(-)